MTFPRSIQGFGEAYMYGDVKVDDLGILLKVRAIFRDGTSIRKRVC